ncbi:MAG: hypothetical protein CVV44_08125 [Spirochaetae bacterium HGW-Spirochaetae-1]|jgi:serine phosphatase RsbU (regulator of sigma subunit)|nr:MAG: hypothetical protein CVV44_08125 [Spirochaetae bacterium HGW-Spirochaetae-1]
MKRINAQLEKQLIRDHIRRAVLTARYAAIYAMAFFIIFAGFDFWTVPHTPGRALVVRFAVVIPSLAVLLVLTFYNIFKIYFQLFVSLMMLVSGGGLLVMFFFTEPGTIGFYFHVMILTILIMTVYLFPRYRLRFALVTAGIISAVFLGLLVRGYTMTGNGSLTHSFIISGVIIITANIAGALLSNAENKFFRIDFLFQRKLVTAYDTLQITYERVQDDLLIAKKIQKNILPSVSKQIEGLSLRVYFQPLQGISGDFYDITELEPGHARIFIADATGHGIQAALITMIIKSEYEMLKRQKISAADLLKQLNVNFINAYRSLETYFSCFIVDIDLKGSMIHYASAGHPGQMLLAGGRTQVLRGGGMIVGDMADADYTLYDHPFQKGDKMLIYTDGLYERVDEDAEESLRVLLEKSIEMNREEHLEKIFAALLTSLDMFDKKNGSDSRHDDITIIGIEHQA